MSDARPPCAVCTGSGIAYDWYDGKLEGWLYEPCPACAGRGYRAGDMYQADEVDEIVQPIALSQLDTVSIALVAMVLSVAAAVAVRS